jgi:hypothetical protein
MRYTVIETFATPRHRFRAGHGISDSWIDGPVSIARWVELGKIAPAEDAVAARHCRRPKSTLPSPPPPTIRRANNPLLSSAPNAAWATALGPL